MKKKHLSIVLTMFMLSTALVACGGNKDTNTSAEAPASNVSEVAVDEVKVVEEAPSKTTEVAEVPATGDAPASGEAFVGDAKTPSEKVLANMSVTTTDYMVNDNIASNPNYIPADELNLNSISDDYEWFMQNHANLDVDVDEPEGQQLAQELYNNQKIIFAGCSKIAEENGYGNITDVKYFVVDTMARVSYGNNVFIDARCYATINDDGNNRIQFTVTDNNKGTQDVALTTDVRPIY